MTYENVDGKEALRFALFLDGERAGWFELHEGEAFLTDAGAEIARAAGLDPMQPGAAILFTMLFIDRKRHAPHDPDGPDVGDGDALMDFWRKEVGGDLLEARATAHRLMGDRFPSG